MIRALCSRFGNLLFESFQLSTENDSLKLCHAQVAAEEIMVVPCGIRGATTVSEATTQVGNFFVCPLPEFRLRLR